MNLEVVVVYYIMLFEYSDDVIYWCVELVIVYGVMCSIGLGLVDFVVWFWWICVEMKRSCGFVFCMWWWLFIFFCDSVVFFCFVCFEWFCGRWCSDEFVVYCGCLWVWCLGWTWSGSSFVISCMFLVLKNCWLCILWLWIAQ